MCRFHTSVKGSFGSRLQFNTQCVTSVNSYRPIELTTDHAKNWKNLVLKLYVAAVEHASYIHVSSINIDTNVADIDHSFHGKVLVKLL